MKILEKYLPYLLGLIAFMLYANTLGHDYAWDDQLVITQNPLTTEGLSGIVDIWTSNDYIIQRPTYRPIPQTLYAIVWEFFPENPAAAHLVNIFLYVVCVLLFVKVLKAYFDNLSNLLVGIIGLFFILLPAHVEVVANIKSGDEILSAIFILLALLVSKKEEFKWTILSIIFFIFALLSKVSAITLFPILLFVILKNNKLKSLVVNVWQQNKIYIIIIIAVLLSFFNYFIDGHKFFSLFLLTLAGALLNFKENKLKNYALALIIIAGIAFYQNEFLVLLLVLYWLSFETKEKITSLRNLLFVLSIYLIIYFFKSNAIAEMLFFLFLIGLTYIIKVKEKVPFYLYFVPLFFIILNIIDVFLYFQIYITWSYLACIPFLLFFNSNRKEIIIFPIVVLGLIFFEFINFKRDYINDITYKSEQVEEDIVINESTAILKNEPYHNILVSASSNAEKFATIARIQLIYLQKLVLPTQLIHQHGTQQIQLASWKDWDVYVSILVHLLLLFLIYFFIKRKEYWIAGGFIWYFLSISIYTNILRLMPDTLAERFLFLPSFGFAVAFVGSIYFFVNQSLKAEHKSLLATSIILSPLFLYFSFKTFDRNKDWKNNYTLAANTLPFAQNNAAINAQYALELNNLMKYNIIPASDSAKALVVTHYKKAIEIFPDFYGPNADLANYFIIEAQPDSAYPYLLEANRLMPKEWLHHYYLGLIHFERNKYTDAQNNFQALIADSTLQSRPFEFPELLEAYEYSARCYHNTGKDPQAYVVLEEAIKIFNQKSSYVLLGNLYRVTGKQKEAVAVFERLLVYNPNDQELINTIQYLKQGSIY